jgi:hypothetical protein
MGRHGFFQLLATTLIFGGIALAQGAGDHSTYFVTYFSNANTAGVPDQTVRVINDGDFNNNLWASFYVFDDSQEMQECCSCAVSPDGLVSESVNTNLTGDSLTGRIKTRGVIKVISSSVAAGGPTNFTNTPKPGLRIWATHVQGPAPTPAGYAVTETGVSDANLIASEETELETLCLYVNLLGGEGPGVCTCTAEGADF